MEDKKNKENEVATPDVTAKITWINDDLESNKRASANITIAKCFTVHGLSVMNSPKGLFVSMPTKVKQDQGGNKYYEIAHPVTAPMRQLISERVLSAYQQMTETQEQEKGQKQEPASHNSDEVSGEKQEQDVNTSEQSSEEDEDEVEETSFVQSMV